MFSRLSEILGRNFAIGYLLPGTVFLLFSLLLADRFDVLPFQRLLGFAEDHAALAAILGPLLLGLWAISLLAINPVILRVKEGYPYRHLPWATLRQRKRYKWLREEIRRIKRDTGPSPLLGRLQTRLATHFPADESLILPTPFGNAVRAFEAYPVQMYGFEATRGWTRLLAVVPADYRDLIEGAKAEVDFLVNLWALSWLFLAEYAAFAVGARRFESLLFPIGAITSIWLSSYWSLGAAVRWGEMVKAAFDVFLPELRKRLGLRQPRTRNEERKMWDSFSQAFLTQQGGLLPQPPTDETAQKQSRGAGQPKPATQEAA